MNAVDIAILVILAAFLLKGLVRGFLKEICSTLGLLAGGFLALYYHLPLAKWLIDHTALQGQWAVGLAFLIIFLTIVLFFAALGLLLSRFISFLFLGGFNRMAGGIFGLLQGVLLLSLILFTVFLQPPQTLQAVLNASELSPPFVELGDALLKGGGQVLAERR
jgi:membrane protein required for colicin V production